MKLPFATDVHIYEDHTKPGDMREGRSGLPWARRLLAAICAIAAATGIAGFASLPSALAIAAQICAMVPPANASRSIEAAIHLAGLTRPMRKVTSPAQPRAIAAVIDLKHGNIRYSGTVHPAPYGSRSCGDKRHHRKCNENTYESHTRKLTKQFHVRTHLLLRRRHKLYRANVGPIARHIV